MEDLRFAVVGIGATGTVLAAALLSRDPETLLVGTGIGQGKALKENGIRVSGALSYDVPVRNYIHSIDGLKDFSPNVVLIATKTFHLEKVLNGLKDNIGPDTKIISSHNGLGPEDQIAEYFGKDAAFRMSLNYGVSLKGFGKAEVAFFNRPNHLGALFGTTCDQCHLPADLTWQQGRYNHAAFPITSGRHAGNRCSVCHVDPTNYKVFSCTVCHDRATTDSHHAGRAGYRYDSNACYSCHPRGSAG